MRQDDRHLQSAQSAQPTDRNAARAIGQRVVAAVMPLVILLVGIVPVVGAEITAQDVRDAIQRGVEYLKKQQREDGSWHEYIGQQGGLSALCTLSLLTAGVDPDDEHIKAALKNLRSRPPQKTYVVSLQTMVLCRAKPIEDQALINRNVQWLVRSQIKEGPRRGSWSYPEGAGDGSNSQFALLALHEAERAAEASGGKIKVDIPQATWHLGRDFWERSQRQEGAWGYYPPLEASGSMTCAGITSMVITADMIHQADAKVTGDHIDCCARADIQNDSVEKALDWLGHNFSVTGNPGQRGGLWAMYYLYGLERAGRLTARRFIGLHDWYREGADHLVQQQDKLSGFWRGVGHSEDDPHVTTSMALLFLAKGRRPLLIAKLKHGFGDDWNQRRNDINNLTIYVESKWKREMNWQVVDLEKAAVEDLLQVPVLFLGGNRSPAGDLAEEKRQQVARKIRDYIDRGGFLFAEGDCCAVGFDKGFRDLMDQVFPEKEYRLKLLDPSHPIWHAEETVSADQLRPLWGIDFGCRTSVVYAPADPIAEPRPSLSCLWEISRSGRQQKFSKAVQDQVDAARAIGINILAYATNRELVDRPVATQNDPSRRPGDQVARGKLYIAKLRHPGGCDAAPRALVNLMESAGRELKIRTEARSILLNITDDALFDYHLVFMHGRNAFRFTDQERVRLKTYLERGGMLFADSICASKPFSESFRREMSTIFPKMPLERIPPGDPIWTKTYGGFDLTTVTRRDPQPSSTEGGPLKAAMRKVPPEMEGIKFGDRYGVIFSQFDLSCALEKQDSLECRGYIREDAAKLGLNVLLYSLQQ